MGKAKHKRQEGAKGSVLEQAEEAYEAGDVVTARKLARKAAAESPEQAAAAEELARRTEVPAKSYLFALVALAFFILLVLLAISQE